MKRVRYVMNSWNSTSGPSVGSAFTTPRVLGGSGSYASGSSSTPARFSSARDQRMRRFFEESSTPDSSNACSAENSAPAIASDA